MSSGNQYTMQKSHNLPTGAEFDVVGRRTLYIPDANQGSYSQELVYDLASVSNSGAWIDWSRSVLSVPIALQCTKSAADTGDVAENAFIMGLKRGDYSILEGLRIEHSGQEIVSLQRSQMSRIGVEILEGFGESDVKLAAEYGYVREDGSKVSAFQSSASAYGLGNIATAAADGTGLRPSVYGMPGRMQRLRSVFNPVSDSRHDDGSGARKQAFSDSRVSIVAEQTTTQTTTFLMLRLPLDCLHEYFKTAPLHRNSVCRISFFIHNNIDTLGQCGRKSCGICGHDWCDFWVQPHAGDPPCLLA
jgi:hypothetical protein